MNLYCLGISHRTAPIDIREKLWFSGDEAASVLSSLQEKYFKELVLVSTCNRTELYYIPSPAPGGLNGEPLWNILASCKNAGNSVRENHFYSMGSLDAVRQLFAVVSGIDSMVIGDVQILNQVKEAFAFAQERKCTGPVLNRLFHSALHVGKRARTETEIGEGAVSVSYAAAELASKIFEDLSKRTALLIGAGETGKLTAKHLSVRNLGSLLIANRTRSRAEEVVAQLHGTVVDYEDILSELPNVDIVVSCVESTSYILTSNDIRQAMKLRGNKPLFIVDIGVPRNIDPQANTIGSVFLHDIDALNHVIDNNLARRKDNIPKIEKIIEEELLQFKSWFESLEVVPTIQELRDQFETIRKAEIDKHLHHFSSESREEIDMLTRRIVNKILHTPTTNLKNGTGEHKEDDMQSKISILRHLFGLDKRTRP
jgi:glutamyl-tRNA reductase